MAAILVGLLVPFAVAESATDGRLNRSAANLDAAPPKGKGVSVEPLFVASGTTCKCPSDGRGIAECSGKGGSLVNALEGLKSCTGTLQELDLDSNSLTGTIPSGLSVLTALDWLDLDSNSLTGTIPSGLSALTALTQLRLDSNRLTGTIASELSVLTALTWLALDSNNLTGTIASGLSTLTALEELNFANNPLANGLQYNCCPEGNCKTAGALGTNCSHLLEYIGSLTPVPTTPTPTTPAPTTPAPTTPAPTIPTPTTPVPTMEAIMCSADTRCNVCSACCQAYLEKTPSACTACVHEKCGRSSSLGAGAIVGIVLGALAGVGLIVTGIMLARSRMGGQPWGRAMTSFDGATEYSRAP